MQDNGFSIIKDKIYDHGTLIGYYQDLTKTDRVNELFDALLVITDGGENEFVYAVSLAPNGAKLVSPKVNTSGFTRKLMGAMGFEAPFSGRLWRGFHDSRTEGIYDSTERLLFDDDITPTKGSFMDYPMELARRLAWLITHFGVVSGRRRYRRRLSHLIEERREYAFDTTGNEVTYIDKRRMPRRPVSVTLHKEDKRSRTNWKNK